MKFKSLLLVVGFVPALVMAQAKPATPSSIEKPIAVNPSERMYHPKIEDKKAEVKAEVTAEVTAKVQAGGINVPVVINPLPGPSGTPKQTQAGEFPAPYPSSAPHVISVGGTTATEFQQKTVTPQPIEKPIEVNPSERMYHPKIQEKREEIHAKVGTEIRVILQSACLPSPCTRADMVEIVEYYLQQLKNQVAVNPSEKMYHPKIQEKREEVRAEIMAKLQTSCLPTLCTPAEMVEILEYMVQQLKNQVAVKAN